MLYPQWFTDIIFAVAKQHGNDIDQAVLDAETQLQANADYPGLAAEMMRQEIRSRIHDARHSMNIKIRVDARTQVDQPTASLLSTGQVEAVYQWTAYSYMIGGKTLGRLNGAELLSLSESLFNNAKVVAGNAKLCKALAAIVPEDSTVQESVSEPRLRKMLSKYVGISEGGSQQRAASA